MTEHAAEEGWPYTVKGGVVHVDASLAEIRTVCFIGEPTITQLWPDPLQTVGSWSIDGSNFGTVEGEVWLGDAATWEGSETRVKQTVSGWDPEAIGMSVVVQDGLPLSPAHVYVYVINDCGERNAVGFETEITEA